jgi:uncharacterized protein involved in exopolysaccharide biosynthesis
VSVETRTERTPAGAPAPRASARSGRIRVRLGFADALLQLWRAKWLMFLVFLPIALAGVALALILPAKYPASTRLLVRPGPEHILYPVSGDAARGDFPQQADVLQAETEFVRSPVIAERVIVRIGLQRLYPGIADAKARAREEQVYVIEQRALEAFARDLAASSWPRSSILKLSYQHTDPQLAADTLNAFVAEYLTYRREVLAGGGAERLSAQRDAIEALLQAADEALRQYARRNNLLDFEVETAAAARRLSQISDQLSAAETSQREAEARADGLRRQMQSTPREVDLYVESASTQELEKLRLQRQDLLARYRPDSRAVQDLDKRIGQLETYVRTEPVTGLRRIGPNPTYQALEASAANEAASAAAMAGKTRELARQKEVAEARLAYLAALAPEYDRLKRDRDALASSASAVAAREQNERVRGELALHNVDNISIYEPARPPARTTSTNRLIAAAAAALGLFAALIAGLWRASSVRTFPTAGSLERTLGLPVLASVADRSRP